MKIASLVLMLVGVLWLIVLGLVYLMMSGISTPAIPQVFWFYVTRGLGGVLLILGSTLVLSQAWSKLGAAFLLVGCAILTYFVISLVLGLSHIEPLERKPDYLDYILYTFFAVVALLSDWMALSLCRLIFLQGSHGGMG